MRFFERAKNADMGDAPSGTAAKSDAYTLVGMLEKVAVLRAPGPGLVFYDLPTPE